MQPPPLAMFRAALDYAYRAEADARGETVRDGAVVEVLDAEIEMPGAVGGLEEGTVQRGRDAVLRELLPDLSI